MGGDELAGGALSGSKAHSLLAAMGSDRGRLILGVGIFSPCSSKCLEKFAESERLWLSV